MNFGFSYLTINTLSDSVDESEINQMQSVADEPVNWSTSNRMNMNSRRTKETRRVAVYPGTHCNIGSKRAC